MVRIACVLFAIAIAAICFAIARVESVGVRIAIFAVSAIPILSGSLFCLVAGVSKYSQTHKRNYFLYNKKLKGDIPVAELGIELIRERVADYMAIFKRGGKIYIGELFEDKPYAPIKEMRPLICYELLYEIAEQGAGAEQYGKVFLGYGEECAQIFMTYLSAASDYELARSVSEYICGYNKGEDALDFCLFLEGKAEYIRERMLDYTKRNIHRFVM